jgi:prepilin-type N-terminal cleavage/methylation domain-containing protein
MKKNQGFTLIEVMITTVIVGILVAIAIPSYNWTTVDAKMMQKKTAITRVAEAKTKYYMDNPTADPTVTPPLDQLIQYLDIDPAVGTNAFNNVPGGIFDGVWGYKQKEFLNPNPKGVVPSFIP